MESVQILLSVYKPNKDYLIKQLQSLNTQNYPNLELLVFDDAGSFSPCDSSVFDEYITNFTYRLLPYESKNLGYAKAFERLINASTGDYLAFCDQDDIWESNKISSCVHEMKKSHSLCCATDKMIIDSHDNVVKESARNGSDKNFNSWHTGDDICKYNLYTTFAEGMSMIVNGNFARNAMPISKYTGHDKWLIACAATEGIVSFIDEPLVRYRRHGNNVSGILPGINSKHDFILKRVNNYRCILNDFFKKYPYHKDRDEIEKFQRAQEKGNIFEINKYRYLAPDLVRFETVLFCVPDGISPLLFQLLRKITK